MTVPPLIPTSLPWVYDLIVGQDWPQADEDALRRAAQAWTEALSGLVGLAEGGDSAAQFIGYSVQSVSSDEFDKYWSRYTQGDDSVVGQMAQQCQGLAELLLQNAEQVEFTKLSIDIQVVILAIQLTIDIATAIVTAGASMAEGAAAAVAARFTIKQLLTELLKGALMAVAPDLITQTIMVAEGHRSSFDVGEALQAAGQGALGAGIGMAVGGVTGRLAKSLTGGLAGEAAESLGGKLLTHAVDVGNAAVTGALTNMVTTAVTDVAGGQGLDNVWSAGANGAANGLLFHGAHALGEGIGSSMRPEPTHFSLANGNELHGLPLKDGSFALFDQSGMKHGTGVIDPRSGELVVNPVAGDPYRSAIAPESKGSAEPVSGPEPEKVGAPEPDPVKGQEPVGEPQQHDSPNLDPQAQHEDSGSRPETAPHSEPGTPTEEHGAPHGEPSQPDPPLTAQPEPPRGEPATLAGVPDPRHSAPSTPNSELPPLAEPPDPQHSEAQLASAPGLDPPMSHQQPESPPVGTHTGFEPDPRSQPTPDVNPAQPPDDPQPVVFDGRDSLPTSGGASLAAAEPVEAAATPQVTALVEHPVTEEAGAPRASSNPILDAMNAAAAPVPPEQHAETFSALGEQPEPTPTPDAHDGKPDESTYLANLKDPGHKAFHDLVREVIEERHQKVLPVLEEVRARLGGEFRGEEHYRKLAESLDRKLLAVEGLTFGDFADPAVGRDAARDKLNELALEINDPLRYTLVFQEGDYARGAAEILQGLHERGFRLLEPITDGDTKIPGSRPLLENGKLPSDAEFAKNFWREGNRYLGINLTLVDEHGGPFELQFHTPTSYEVKEHLSHLQYEVFRNPEAPMERRINAMLELVSLSDKHLWGRVPEGLDEFAPRAKNNGMDKLFEKIGEDYGSGAETPEELYQADQKLIPLEIRQEEIRKANQDLAEHLNRLTGGGLSESEIQQAFLETVDLLRVRDRLTTDPAEWRRLQYETPTYEPPQHGPGPAHQNAEPNPHAHQPQPDQPSTHHNDPTALGAPATDNAHPTLHLEHPIALSPDHLVFPFHDEAGNHQFAHLRQVGERWVLHAGGPEGEALTALGDHLRTTPPGLDLIGHATPDGFLLAGKTIPFEDVLAHIPAATTGEGPIRLIACDAGGATGEAAQRLADLSGRTVIAADTPVWVAKDGHVVASNPVDRATNWYPKRPPDGVWSSYEPGGAPARLASTDPRVPEAPKDWRPTAPVGSPDPEPTTEHEFTALGNDRNALPAKSGDSSAAYAKNPVERPVDDKAPLPPEAKREMGHTILGNELRKAGANRLFERAVNQRMAEAASTFTMKDLEAAYKRHPGTDKASARPLRPRILDEVVALSKEGLAELVKGRSSSKRRVSSFVMIGDIVVEQSVDLKNPQPSTVRIESFPNKHHSYKSIAQDLGEFCIRLKAADVANPDERLAGALKRLLSEEPLEPQDRTRPLKDLAELAAAQEFDAGRNREPLSEENFVQLGGALAHLIGHLEPARDPRALLNLANLDIAEHGGMTVADAVWFFNPVSQVGGARQALETHVRITGHDGQEPPPENIPDLQRAWTRNGEFDAHSLRRSVKTSYFHDIPKLKPLVREDGSVREPPQISTDKKQLVEFLHKGEADALAKAEAAARASLPQASQPEDVTKAVTQARAEAARKWAAENDEIIAPLFALAGGENWDPDSTFPRGTYTETEVSSRFDPDLLDHRFEDIPKMPFAEFKELLNAAKQRTDLDDWTRHELLDHYIQRRKAPDTVTRETVLDSYRQVRKQWDVAPLVPAAKSLETMTSAQYRELLHRAAIGAAVHQDAEVELRMRNALARFIEQGYTPPTQKQALPRMDEVLNAIFASYGSPHAP